MIIERLQKKIEKERHKLYPQHVNRCSSIGFPCNRFLVYSIIRWKDKKIPSIELQQIFNEGNKQERIIRRDIEEAGFDILEVGAEVSFEKERLYGHIDGIIKYRKSKILLEIKTVSTNIFPKLNNEIDFITSKKPYHQCYIPQLLLYMKGKNLKRGLLLLKDKNNGNLKELEIKYDKFMADSYLHKCTTINERVDKIREVLKETYQIKDIADFDKKKDFEDYINIRNDACKIIEDYMPERINDIFTCEHCPFEHICLPDKIREQRAQVMINEEFEQKLKDRDNLIITKTLYDKLDKEIKEIAKQTGFDFFLCGDFEITIKRDKRTTVKIERISPR